MNSSDDLYLAQDTLVISLPASLIATCQVVARDAGQSATSVTSPLGLDIHPVPSPLDLLHGEVQPPVVLRTGSLSVLRVVSCTSIRKHTSVGYLDPGKWTSTDT